MTKIKIAVAGCLGRMGQELSKKIIANNITQMEKNLMDLDNFTSTSPIAFRSNLKLELKDGGFSSYQSEYPFSMTTKKGSIVSPLSTLLNKNNLCKLRLSYE